MAAQLKNNNGGNSEILVTRDFLGTLSNPDLQIPKLWEIPLDFKAGISDEEEKRERALVELKLVSWSGVEKESGILRKRHISEMEMDERMISKNCGMFAASCPACFMYVMTFNNNPICPRCNSTCPVPSPFSFHTKKLRF